MFRIYVDKCSGKANEGAMFSSVNVNELTTMKLNCSGFATKLHTAVVNR